jgi:hypothetical protein
MRSLVLVVLVVCACGVQIDGDTRSSGTTIDAPGGSTGDDAAVVTDDAPPVAACPNGKKLFLSFEAGVTLMDAAKSDATQNLASWMTNGVTTAAVPAYKAGDPNRLIIIQQIVDGVKLQLAAYPIEVVTTRPASGPYMMMTFGGTAQQVGSRFGGGVQELDCGDLTLNDTAWIGDNVSPNQRVINTVIGAIGFGLGLTATLDPKGCMCRWDNDCVRDDSGPCVLSSNIARDPQARQLCPGLTTQDEIAAFATDFCQ